MERAKINLTHESKHHHPSHIDSPPPPLACNLPPLFARPLAHPHQLPQSVQKVAQKVIHMKGQHLE